MKFISFKAKYYICYKIVQFCSIFLCIPISIYPFLTKRLFWHPLELEWYQKTMQSYKICYDEYLYPSETAIWSAIIIFLSSIGILIMILNCLDFVYFLLNLTIVGHILINSSIYRNAIYYKHHKHIYKQLNQVHKL